MTFPNSKSNDICIKLNETILEHVGLTDCRYVGVVFNDHLNWTAHIDKLYNKLLKYVGIFYKIRNKLPASILKDVYSDVSPWP